MDLIEFLNENGILGTNFMFNQSGAEKRLSFVPSTKTRIGTVRGLIPDISLRVRAGYGLEVQGNIKEGTIEISWQECAPSPKMLPTSTKLWCLPVGTIRDGTDKFVDMRLAPHILVAGASGSGKSYWLHGVLRHAIEQNFSTVVFDPKFGEFSEYSDRVTHINVHDSIFEYTATLVTHMDERFKNIALAKAKNIIEYNLIETTNKYRPILLIVDEYADLALADNTKAWQNNMQRLAQKGRAAGIHLIISTQTPTATLFPGGMRANFPVRIAFKTANHIASKVIGVQGAEALNGRGDGIIVDEYGKTVRFQTYKLHPNIT
jgi:DNA segregation ATPase FtsK/SpoIIIE-like protein